MNCDPPTKINESKEKGNLIERFIVGLEFLLIEIELHCKHSSKPTNNFQSNLNYFGVTSTNPNEN